MNVVKPIVSISEQNGSTNCGTDNRPNDENPEVSGRK